MKKKYVQKVCALQPCGNKTWRDQMSLPEIRKETNKNKQTYNSHQDGLGFRGHRIVVSRHPGRGVLGDPIDPISDVRDLPCNTTIARASMNDSRKHQFCLVVNRDLVEPGTSTVSCLHAR